MDSTESSKTNISETPNCTSDSFRIQNSINNDKTKTKETENFIFPKKISTTYSYNDCIKRVWDVICDFDKCTPEFSDMRGKCEFIQGSNTYELGNEFKMTWSESSHLHFKCISVIDDEHSKKISWRVSSLQYQVAYTQTFTVHSNTIEKNCVFIWDIDYDEPEKLPFDKQTLVNFHKILLESCKKYELILKKSLDNLNQTESVIINKDKEAIWKLIADWKLFVKLVPTVADVVEYEGDPMLINSVVILRFNKTKEIECRLRVIKFANKADEEKWEYVLECFEGKPKIPKQILTFSLMDISDNITFILFKHEFRQSVKYELIQSIASEKKKILSELKKHFESAV